MGRAPGGPRGDSVRTGPERRARGEGPAAAKAKPEPRARARTRTRSAATDSRLVRIARTTFSRFRLSRVRLRTKRRTSPRRTSTAPLPTAREPSRMTSAPRRKRSSRRLLSSLPSGWWSPSLRCVGAVYTDRSVPANLFDRASPRSIGFGRPRPGSRRARHGPRERAAGGYRGPRSRRVADRAARRGRRPGDHAAPGPTASPTPTPKVPRVP